MPDPWPAGVPVDLAIILAAGGGATGRWWPNDPDVQFLPAGGRRFWVAVYDPCLDESFVQATPLPIDAAIATCELIFANECRWRVPTGWAGVEWSPVAAKASETMPFNVGG